MTIFEIAQLCKEEIPGVAETMVIELLNGQIKDFCHRTEVYQLVGNLTIVSNTVTYNLLTAFPLMDVPLIKDINFYQTDGSLVRDDDKPKFTIVNGYITFYDNYGDTLTQIPTIVNTITITYVAIPPTKIVTDTLVEIDSQFHEKLRSGVMTFLYKLYPTIEKVLPDNSKAMMKDIAMIQYCETQYEKGVILGKKFANAYPSLHKEIYNQGY